MYHLDLRAHARNVTEERHKIRREKVRSRRPVYYVFLQKFRSGDNELAQNEGTFKFSQFRCHFEKYYSKNLFFILF